MKEFKEFVMRGNVLDLAVGVIIGGAFNSIVTSLCNDVIMPSVAWIVATASGMDLVNPETNQIDFSKALQSLNVGPINFGNFIGAIISFLILALIIFLFVKGINKLMSVGKKPVEEAAPTTKKCPFCKSEIDIEATRCPNCTSMLEAAEEALKKYSSRAEKRTSPEGLPQSLKSSAVNFGSVGMDCGSRFSGS